MMNAQHPFVHLRRQGLAILLTNDDGIDSPGLFALKQSLGPLGDVHVLAPDRNRTGSARSITMRAPLWVEERILPDGSVGHCTDAAAFEGIMLGIPSLAVSADGYDDGYDLSVPARVSRLLVESILRNGFPADALLNINCPDLAWDELGGIRLTTLGKRIYGDRVQLRESRGARRRYFIYGDDLSYHSEAGTDFDAIGDGCVSVTPIHFQLTAHDLLHRLEEWRLDLADAVWEPAPGAWALPGDGLTGEIMHGVADGGIHGAASQVGGSGPLVVRSPLEPEPKVVIFDLDGTVLDSVELIVDSFDHAVWSVLGHRSSREDAVRHVGRPLLEQMELIDEVRAQELVDAYREFNHREHDRRVRLYPGMADLLLRLRARGARLALVTSKSRPTTEMAFRVTGVGELFEEVVCAGETTYHKPHPEPLLRVLDSLGAGPESAVYIGDSPYDLQAAAGAGIRSVGVTWGVFPEEDLAAESPDRLVREMQELSFVLTGLDGR